MSVAVAPQEVQPAAEESGRTSMNNEDRKRVREHAAEHQITRHEAFNALGMPGENPYSPTGQHPTSASSATKPKATSKPKGKPKATAKKKPQQRRAPESRDGLQVALANRLREIDAERAQITAAMMDRLSGNVVRVGKGQTLVVEPSADVEVIVPRKARYRVLSEA